MTHHRLLRIVNRPQVQPVGAARDGSVAGVRRRVADAEEAGGHFGLSNLDFGFRTNYANASVTLSAGRSTRKRGIAGSVPSNPKSTVGDPFTGSASVDACPFRTPGKRVR